jgi:hypothetical protein
MRRFLIYLSILSMVCCQTPNLLKKKNEDIFKVPKPIYIYQNKTEQVVTEQESEIHIEKAPFKIRFYNSTYSIDKHNSTQIAVFLNDSEFNKIKTNTPIKDVPCFGPGTGYAMYADGTDKDLLFENHNHYLGHHYLFYENESSRRVNLLEDYGDFLKLEFEVNQFHIRNSNNGLQTRDTIIKKNIPEVDITKFYLAILIDNNLNDTINDGELHKLIVNFK